MTIDNFYNPDLMPIEEVKATFVARQGLVDELVKLVDKQPKGAGTQHVVIIAPRGMGKTTVLLMVQLAIRQRNLNRWVGVKFPEESYQISDLADFWLAVLDHTATETNDEDLLSKIDQIKKRYTATDTLQQAALALIRDWTKKRRKRIAVLIENFDGILEQINDERANAALRHALMNEGSVMLIAGATTHFEEARAHDQPLYNFFKIYNLNRLSFDDMQDLLRRRAAVDGLTNFDQILENNRSRLRALEYFTDGNPRLALMLYRVITQSELTEVHHGLQKLLDEVTPYYKAKIESLPVQQRKILDNIARLTSETGMGQTPAEIAKATRLPANQVSTQLKRLADVGYVRAANVRGRNSFYTLSDRLYAIWHQMRMSRDARQRMRWLIDFLKHWFNVPEMLSTLQELDEKVNALIEDEKQDSAKRMLEYMRLLADACPEGQDRSAFFDLIALATIRLKDRVFMERLLVDINCSRLSSRVKELITLFWLATELVDGKRYDRLDPIVEEFFAEGACGGELFGASLLLVARFFGLTALRELLLSSRSKIQLHLRPYVIACDFLLTGDKSSIEKLSPEIKGVVENIVRELEKSNLASSQQKRTPPKRRTHKVKMSSPRRKPLSAALK